MRFCSVHAPPVACATLLALSACSGAVPSVPAGPVSAVGNGIRPAKSLMAPERLAVSLYTSVVVLDSSYKVIQTITNGVKAGDGDYYDSKGNLYLANFEGPNVTEYNKAGTIVFTYSTGLGDPGFVTVAKNGDVYVTDGNDDLVVEYPQASNTPIASCSNDFVTTTGVALDSNGNVFVGGNFRSDLGGIVEYKGGLSGCNATALAVPIGYVVGLGVDEHDNLFACDPYVGVDIIPAPYTKVEGTITGLTDPQAASLNRDQSLIYVANNGYPYNPTVVVDKYPSGTNVTTLGSSNGITGSIADAAAYR